MLDHRVLLACAVVATAIASTPVAATSAPESTDVPVLDVDAGNGLSSTTGPIRWDRPPPASSRQHRPTDCQARDGPASGAAIQSVYPNPTAAGDRGEFVTVGFPDDTALEDWTLADDDTAVSLPNRTVSGPVVITTHPTFATNLTGDPVIRIDAGFALSNAGETVTLRRCETVVDAVTYPNAPEAERWVDGTWQPLGATEFDPVVVENAAVRAFTLPDAPTVPTETLRAADERLLLAGYTFGSERAATALREAAARGVETRVLLDGSPVGGLSRREAVLLDRLVAAGVAVRVLAGPLARYAFHHPKYAVVDDRALVASENWKPAGTGGNASRGWGVVVRNRTVADGLAAVFRADAGWRAAIPWQEYRTTKTVDGGPPSNGSYPASFEPERFRVDSVRLLVAPENAEDGVVALLGAANDSIAVEQVRIEPGSRFLRATIAAARRGVAVRVLLSAAWYVEGDNQRLADRLNRLAARERLPLEARLVDPGGRFEKIHVKGLVVDDRRVVVGSLNWNNNSARENREVVVVLEGDEVGAYYADVFAADWRGGAWRVTVGLGVAAVLAWIAAFGVAVRTVRFAGKEGSVGFDVGGGSRNGGGPGGGGR